MTRSSVKFLKGVGIGALMGCVAGVIGCCCIKRHKRCFKRSMGKVLRNMSELVDNVSGMF